MTEPDEAAGSPERRGRSGEPRNAEWRTGRRFAEDTSPGQRLTADQGGWFGVTGVGGGGDDAGGDRGGTGAARPRPDGAQRSGSTPVEPVEPADPAVPENGEPTPGDPVPAADRVRTTDTPDDPPPARAAEPADAPDTRPDSGGDEPVDGGSDDGLPALREVTPPNTGGDTGHNTARPLVKWSFTDLRDAVGGATDDPVGVRGDGGEPISRTETPAAPETDASVEDRPHPPADSPDTAEPDSAADQGHAPSGTAGAEPPEPELWRGDEGATGRADLSFFHGDRPAAVAPRPAPHAGPAAADDVPRRPRFADPGPSAAQEDPAWPVPETEESADPGDGAKASGEPRRPADPDAKHDPDDDASAAPSGAGPAGPASAAAEPQEAAPDVGEAPASERDAGPADSGGTEVPGAADSAADEPAPVRPRPEDPAARSAPGEDAWHTYTDEAFVVAAGADPMSTQALAETIAAPARSAGPSGDSEGFAEGADTARPQPEPGASGTDEPPAATVRADRAETTGPQAGDRADAPRRGDADDTAAHDDRGEPPPSTDRGDAPPPSAPPPSPAVTGRPEAGSAGSARPPAPASGAPAPAVADNGPWTAQAHGLPQGTRRWYRDDTTGSGNPFPVTPLWPSSAELGRPAPSTQEQRNSMRTGRPRFESAVPGPVGHQPYPHQGGPPRPGNGGPISYVPPHPVPPPPNARYGDTPYGGPAPTGPAPYGPRPGAGHPAGGPPVPHPQQPQYAYPPVPPAPAPAPHPGATAGPQTLYGPAATGRHGQGPARPPAPPAGYPAPHAPAPQPSPFQDAYAGPGHPAPHTQVPSGPHGPQNPQGPYSGGGPGVRFLPPAPPGAPPGYGAPHWPQQPVRPRGPAKPERDITRGEHRVHAATIPLQALVVALVFLAVPGVLLLDFGLLWVLLLTVSVLFGAAAYSALAWWQSSFGLRDDHLVVHSGLFRKVSREIPLSRLQAVDVVRPVVMQALGLAELRVELAGGDSGEIRLRYLGRRTAERLRASLLAHAAGLSGRTPEAPEWPFYKLPFGLLLGAMAFRLPVLGAFVLFMVLIVAGFAFMEAGVLGGAVPLLLGLIRGFFGPLLRYTDFYSALSPDGLRLRYGIFQARMQTVPPGRVQAVRIVEPLLWRSMGVARVEANVAGYVGERQMDSSTLLPVVPRDLAFALVGELLPGVDVSATALRDARRSRGAKDAMGVGEGAFVTRRGFLCVVHEIVPHARVQGVRLTAGPLSSLLGVATVEADTPPGPVRARAPGRDAVEARRTVDEIAERAHRARTSTGGPERWATRSDSESSEH